MKRKKTYKSEKDFQSDFLKYLRTEKGFRAYKLPDVGYELKPFDIVAIKDGIGYGIELKYGNVDTYEKIFKMLRPNQVGGLQHVKEHGGQAYVIGRDSGQNKIYKYKYEFLNDTKEEEL